jgi:hypothetical protein
MNIMSRSNCSATQTSFSYAPIGAGDRLWLLLKGMVRFEPAASAIYAENARIRDTGRTWLM